MSSEQLLDRLDRLLAEERAAIARLDGGFVASAAPVKAALLEDLRAYDLNDPPEVKQRVQRLLVELRRNAVLLAHARDCLQDVLEGPRAPLEGSGRRSTGPSASAPLCLSLRG